MASPRKLGQMPRLRQAGADEAGGLAALDGELPPPVNHPLREQRRTSLEAALSDGTERADIVLHMPPGSAGTMAQLLDLLELADEFCRAERLLTLAATPQQYQLQRWYLGEFVRQARGESPLPWAGTYEVDPSYRQSAS